MFISRLSRNFRIICRNNSTVYRKVKRMSGDSVKVRSNPIVVKLDTPQYKAIFTDELNRLIDIFQKTDFEIRLAGGPVRDLLMNKVPEDIDIATTATPTQMKDIFTEENVRMVNTNGEKHGTITARINDKINYEITTLRIDEETDGRHAKVVFTTDWQLDANRRDLTVNSMFMDFSGNVYDYFFGYDDLKINRVAFVGVADERIKEDYLRILRYFRFYGRISIEPNKHEETTLEAIKNNIDGLSQISGERIWSELKKILQGNFSQELVLRILECNAAKSMGLPVPPNISEFNQIYKYKSDKHPMNPITKLVALLYNQEDALKLHERLKFSAFERDLMFFLVQNRDAFKTKDELFFKKLCFKIPGQVAVTKLFVIELLKYLNFNEEFVEELINWQQPQFPINGKLLKAHNCPPGQTMGQVMQTLREFWMDSKFKLSQDQLLKMAPKVIQDCASKATTNQKRKLEN